MKEDAFLAAEGLFSTPCVGQLCSRTPVHRYRLVSALQVLGKRPAHARWVINTTDQMEKQLQAALSGSFFSGAEVS